MAKLFWNTLLHSLRRSGCVVDYARLSDVELLQVQSLNLLVKARKSAISPSVYQLAQGVVQTMLLKRIRVAAAVFVVVACSAGYGWLKFAQFNGMERKGREATIEEPPVLDPAPEAKNQSAAPKPLDEDEINKIIAELQPKGATFRHDETRPANPVVHADWTLLFGGKASIATRNCLHDSSISKTSGWVESMSRTSI